MAVSALCALAAIFWVWAFQSSWLSNQIPNHRMALGGGSRKVLPWAEGIVQGDGGSAYALSIPRAGEVHDFSLGRVKGQAKGGKVGGQSVISSLQFNCISKDRGAGAPEEVVIHKGSEHDVCAFKKRKGRSCKELC